MKKVLIIHLDAPMQSWDIESRYEQRRAGDAPSKSALCGMICAAMGAHRESSEESAVIRACAESRLTVYALVPSNSVSGGLLRDYHTVQGTRNAEGKELKYAVQTFRFYHQGKRFAALLESENADFLERARQALLNPVWGVWFGRKCCIPAAPLIREPLTGREDADELIRRAYEKHDWEIAETFEEVKDFSDGTDTWNDQPISFGRSHSSGGENRCYSARRIRHKLSEKKHVKQDLGEDSFFQGF